MRRVLMLLVALAMVATGCGGDDSGDSGAGQALAEAIRDEILEDNDPDSPFGETEATCVGEEAVSEFGVEGLIELGITEDNASAGDAFETASDEDRRRLIDVTLECIDFKQFFVDQLTADSDISDESAECLGNELGTREFLDPLVEAGLAGNDDAFLDDEQLTGLIFGAITTCLSLSELEQLGGG